MISKDSAAHPILQDFPAPSLGVSYPNGNMAPPVWQTNYSSGTQVIERGLTIRAHMATEFMKGMITAIGGTDQKPDVLPPFAKLAVAYADQLIEELNK